MSNGAFRNLPPFAVLKFVGEEEADRECRGSRIGDGDKMPFVQYGNNAPDFPEALADEFSLCSSTFVNFNNYSFEDDSAAALALILDKYNAGIA